MDAPKQAHSAQPRKRRWLPSLPAITGVALVGLVAYGLLQGGGPSSEDQQVERDRVAACWSDAARKTGSADEQRTRTAACEGLQSEFRKKYGGTP